MKVLQVVRYRSDELDGRKEYAEADSADGRHDSGNIPSWHGNGIPRSLPKDGDRPSCHSEQYEQDAKNYPTRASAEYADWTE
jgi:hypothetical protein